MGNLCNADYRGQKKKSFISKKKRVLKDQMTKNHYEEQITKTYNNVMSEYSKQNFCPKKLKINSLIGKGGQGSVFLIQMEEDGSNGEAKSRSYAMKRIPKKKNKTPEARRSLLLQNKIMSEISSPFVSRMKLSCEDPTYLYYFMDVAAGGDLQSYTQSYIGKGNQFRKLGQQAIQFIAAGVLLGLQCLHSHKIIYRDLKAENILISQDGYPILSDFGLALPDNNGKYFEPRGTVLYFAPEIISGHGYNRGIDFWAFGILLYFLAYEDYPFCTDDVIEPSFPDVVKRRQGNFKKSSRKTSESLRNLINRLLVCRKQDRIGYNSFEEIKKHEFFNNINWQTYERKGYKSPLEKIVKKYPIQFSELDAHSEAVDSDIADSFSFSNARISMHSSCYQSQTTKQDSDHCYS